MEKDTPTHLTGKGRRPLDRYPLTPACEGIARLKITGNMIPRSWPRHPTLRTKGKNPNLPAILVLADICNWYKPASERSGGGRKFDGKLLHKRYAKWADDLGLSEPTCRNAVKFLKSRGLIRTEVRTARRKRGAPLPNALYIEPVPDAIAALAEVPADAGRPGRRRRGVVVVAVTSPGSGLFTIRHRGKDPGRVAGEVRMIPCDDAARVAEHLWDKFDPMYQPGVGYRLGDDGLRYVESLDREEDGWLYREGDEPERVGGGRRWCFAKHHLPLCKAG